MKAFSELTSASQVNNADILAISQENSGSYASKKTTVKDVTDFANLNIAEEYDSTSSYAADDYCIYESVLYKCTASTTGTFDPTKWTAVVVTDEMGSGGGGGTGGHTIINENGTSMTARSGLQFVGGANVSDDSTNNKTVVDISGASGIDGVFIDTDNVIQASTTIPTSNEVTYTATEDCAINFVIYSTGGGGGSNGYLKLDDEWIFAIGGGSLIRDTLFVKKGQVVDFKSAGTNGSYTVFGIQTGTTHSKFQPVIYSTEEREIGVWTNGKPLYEKTIVDTLPSTTTSKDISLNISNIDNIISIKGIAIRSDGATTQIEHARTDYTIWSMINGAKTVLSINIKDSSYINQPVHFTVQYTKTTDVAGSGSWTPQGVPSVHYSTDEQIIGTYLGDTLCQKTIHNVSITSGVQWIDTDIDSTCKIIETKGTLFKSNGDIATMPCADSGSSINDSSVAGINTCSVGIVTTGKWSVLFRTLKSDMRGDLDLTVIYTKS